MTNLSKAYQGKEPYVFSSFAHKSADRVFPIISGLQNRGFRVWYDDGIQCDMEWPAVVADRLSDSGCVLVLITKEYAESRYCREELNYAIYNKLPVLVVFVEEVSLSQGVRFQLGMLQTIFCYRYPDTESFLNTLCSAAVLQPCREETAVIPKQTAPVNKPKEAAPIFAKEDGEAKKGYTFISYSTKNQAAADALRALAAQNNIPTWMAPYDIPAGSKYAAQITKAIRECTCFTLILSNDSQNSDAVDREVELAALEFKKPLVIAQIEPVTLNDSFFFYLHNQQIEAVSDFSQDSPGRRKIIQAIVKHLAADESCEAFLRISCKGDKVIQSNEVPVTKSAAQCLFERGQQVYELDMCSSSNIVEAVRLFRLAAEQGHAEAQYMLAKLRYIYRYDEAVDITDEEAARWASLAARQGHREAQSEVGTFYLWGRGVEENVEEALRWFRLAAEGGDSEAQYYLGLCYYWGEGVERDVILCRHWLEKAAEQRHFHAIEALDALCAGGDFPTLCDLM